MLKARLPKRVERPRRVAEQRQCPGHRAWVRRHHCCVPDCLKLPIECAHVRGGTDGGMALKPSDRWVISLCSHHHRQQHEIGEKAFERRYGLDLLQIAEEFARASPMRSSLVAKTQEKAAPRSAESASGSVAPIAGPAPA